MRTILTVALAIGCLEIGAQTPPLPPAPPAQPAPPARPAIGARPVPPAPPAHPAPPALPARSRTPEVGDPWYGRGFMADDAVFGRDFNFDFNFDFNRDFDFDHLRFEEMQHALEATRLDHAAIARSVDSEMLRSEALRAVEMSHIDIEGRRFDVENAVNMARAGIASAPVALAHELSMLEGRPARSTLTVVAPAPWLSQDPADSLYRVARDLLNRSQYRSATETFRLISMRYPTSGYTPDAMYFEAYSLYKIGGQNELRTALEVLDRQKAKFPNAKLPDPGLVTRIQGELASRGDPAAAQYVATTASRQGQSCNRDDMAVRLEALNALSRMNVDSTTPILRRVLSRRDECSVGLRRQAITLMAKNPDASTTDIIIDVLRNDPSPEVRRAAISWLGEVPSERGAAALDEILRSPKEEDLHSRALRALSSTRNPRAAQALRAMIERRDVSENLRREAMMQLTRTDSAGASAYLRSLYPKLESRQLKSYALTQIARLRGDDNAKWMLAFVRDTTEPVELRRSALSTLTRSSTTSVAEVGGLYRNVPELELKQAIITALASRKEPEAVDQLISIYHASTDSKLKLSIINVLSRRDDPRTIKLLSEILK